MAETGPVDKTLPAPAGSVQTYAMVERGDHREFDIRDQSVRAP